MEQISGYQILLRLSKDLYHMWLPLQMAMFFEVILTKKWSKSIHLLSWPNNGQSHVSKLKEMVTQQTMLVEKGKRKAEKVSASIEALQENCNSHR